MIKTDNRNITFSKPIAKVILSSRIYFLHSFWCFNSSVCLILFRVANLCHRICIHYCLYTKLLNCALFCVMSYTCCVCVWVCVCVCVCLLLSRWLRPVCFHRHLSNMDDCKRVPDRTFVKWECLVLRNHKGLNCFEFVVL
jgi:hypothetical protein